jgi:hypothetical protein
MRHFLAIVCLLLTSTAYGQIVTIGGNTGDDFTGVEDTFLDSAQATTNFSGNTDISISKYDTGSHGHGIVKVTGLSNITGPVTVNEARLCGSIEYLSISAGYTVTARRLLRNTNVSQATWNVYSTGNNWGTAGGLSDGVDRVGTASGTFVAAGTEAYQDEVCITGLAQDVEDWINGTNPNYGWHLERTDGVDDNEFFGLTSSDGDDGFRPYLYVDYTAGGGGSSVLPIIMQQH